MEPGVHLDNSSETLWPCKRLSLSVRSRVPATGSTFALKYSGSFPMGQLTLQPVVRKFQFGIYNVIIQALQVLTTNGITPNYLDLEGEPNAGRQY